MNGIALIIRCRDTGERFWLGDAKLRAWLIGGGKSPNEQVGRLRLPIDVCETTALQSTVTTS
jgi:hypothetical protein